MSLSLVPSCQLLKLFVPLSSGVEITGIAEVLVRTPISNDNINWSTTASFPLASEVEITGTLEVLVHTPISNDNTN